MQDRTVTLYSEMRAAWRAAGTAIGADATTFEERHAALSREFDAATPTTPLGVAAKIREALRMRTAWRYPLRPNVARKASSIAVRFARDEHTAEDMTALWGLHAYAEMICAQYPEDAEYAGVDYVVELFASALKGLEGLRPRALH